MASVRISLRSSLMVLSCAFIGGLLGSARADISLYQRLGGRQSINVIVSDFVDMTMKDARIRINHNSNEYMNHCDPKVIKARLSAIICEETGGPCHASEARAEMRKSMSALDFGESDWKAMREDFLAALNKFKVAPADQLELDQILDRARQHSVRSD